jgi:hypothetical protein
MAGLAGPGRMGMVLELREILRAIRDRPYSQCPSLKTSDLRWYLDLEPISGGTHEEIISHGLAADHHRFMELRPRRKSRNLL